MDGDVVVEVVAATSDHLTKVKVTAERVVPLMGSGSIPGLPPPAGFALPAPKWRNISSSALENRYKNYIYIYIIKILKSGQFF